MNRNLIIGLIAIVAIVIVVIGAKPVGIVPLQNPDHERIRRSFAHDLLKRGWRKAYQRFLLDTNPGQPGSVSVDAINASYRAIYRESVDNPELR